jgi:hypothetical protein
MGLQPSLQQHEHRDSVAGQEATRCVPWPQHDPLVRSNSWWSSEAAAVVTVLIVLGSFLSNYVALKRPQQCL